MEHRRLFENLFLAGVQLFIGIVNSVFHMEHFYAGMFPCGRYRPDGE